MKDKIPRITKEMTVFKLATDRIVINEEYLKKNDGENLGFYKIRESRRTEMSLI